jgi:hypothetical protein
MFEPLGKIIDMLRAYGVVIPEESLVQLQELPDKWANTKRLSVMAIQQVCAELPGGVLWGPLWSFGVLWDPLGSFGSFEVLQGLSEEAILCEGVHCVTKSIF